MMVAPPVVVGAVQLTVADPSPGVKLRYITNHDDASSDGSTITEYKGQAGAISAFVLAAYMDGIPLIYDSQEVGYPNAINFFNVVPVNYNSNPAMVAAYKNILAFRAAHPAIKTGTLTAYGDATVVAFEKKSGTDDVLVIVNPTGNTVNYSVPTAIQGTWQSGFQPAYFTLSSQTTLPPYAAYVLVKI